MMKLEVVTVMMLAVIPNMTEAGFEMILSFASNKFG